MTEALIIEKIENGFIVRIYDVQYGKVYFKTLDEAFNYLKSNWIEEIGEVTGSAEPRKWGD